MMINRDFLKVLQIYLNNALFILGNSALERKQFYGWMIHGHSCIFMSNFMVFDHPMALDLRLHANGCNNSQQCWDLQRIMGRIQPISLCKLCVMSVRGLNNVGRAVQTDPTLLRYALVITK